VPFVNYKGRNICFVHIPKTGGTAVEKWMARYGVVRLHHVDVPMTSRITPQHFTANNLKEFFGHDFFDYQFTIVRNPYDRLESEYRQQWIISKESFWEGAPTFSYFVERNVAEARNNPFHRDNHMRPQVDFLGANVRIFRYESGLDAIVREVCADLGLEFVPCAERVLSSEKFGGQIEWDLQDRLIVNDFYQKDFSTLKYATIAL